MCWIRGHYNQIGAARLVGYLSLGTLRKNDSDGNENVNKEKV